MQDLDWDKARVLVVDMPMEACAGCGGPWADHGDMNAQPSCWQRVNGEDSEDFDLEHKVLRKIHVIYNDAVACFVDGATSGCLYVSLEHLLDVPNGEPEHRRRAEERERRRTLAKQAVKERGNTTAILHTDCAEKKKKQKKKNPPAHGSKLGVLEKTERQEAATTSGSSVKQSRLSPSPLLTALPPLKRKNLEMKAVLQKKKKKTLPGHVEKDSGGDGWSYHLTRGEWGSGLADVSDPTLPIRSPQRLSDMDDQLTRMDFPVSIHFPTNSSMSKDKQQSIVKQHEGKTVINKFQPNEAFPFRPFIELNKDSKFFRNHYMNCDNFVEL